MKKTAMLLMVILLMSVCCAAMAEKDAPEITAGCQIELSGVKNPKNMTDRKFTTNSESKPQKNPTLTISSDKAIRGLYLCFQKKPESYEIQVKRGGSWETYCAGNAFIHAFYALDGVQDVRVYTAGSGKQVLGFNEVYVFGEGRLPGWVQRWEPTPEKSDILFAVAHPEEELLYLGGAIPYYAREQERTVAVALLSYANTTRRSEFLNGLWSMGYRQYPVIGEFKTAKAKSMKAAYKSAGGEQKVISWLANVLEQTKPEVLAGPDENGEGNNSQRMMLADACRKVFLTSNGWQPRKLYLHLFGNSGNQVVFDWNQPMEKLGGRTGIGLARSEEHTSEFSHAR